MILTEELVDAQKTERGCYLPFEAVNRTFLKTELTVSEARYCEPEQVYYNISLYLSEPDFSALFAPLPELRNGGEQRVGGGIDSRFNGVLNYADDEPDADDLHCDIV